MSFIDCIVISLPGHGSSLHDRVCSLAPVHCAPPKAGGGLVQVRERPCTPPPHVLVQTLQLLQTVHLPSTKVCTNRQRERCESYRYTRICSLFLARNLTICSFQLNELIM